MKYAIVEAKYISGAREDDGFYRLTITKTPELITKLIEMTVRNEGVTPCEVNNRFIRPLLIRDIARLVRGTNIELLFCDGESFSLEFNDMERVERGIQDIKSGIEKLLRTNLKLHSILAMKEIKTPDNEGE
jgi:hypothetical protein